MQAMERVSFKEAFNFNPALPSRSKILSQLPLACHPKMKFQKAAKQPFTREKFLWV